MKKQERQIIRLNITDHKYIEMYRVISEPGDHTRYDYFINRLDYDTFLFMSCTNTFAYPQRLTLIHLDLLDADVIEDLYDYANDIGVNPHTLVECINAIKDILKKERS